MSSLSYSSGVAAVASRTRPHERARPEVRVEEGEETKTNSDGAGDGSGVRPVLGVLVEGRGAEAEGDGFCVGGAALLRGVEEEAPEDVEVVWGKSLQTVPTADLQPRRNNLLLLF